MVASSPPTIWGAIFEPDSDAVAVAPGMSVATGAGVGVEVGVEVGAGVDVSLGVGVVVCAGGVERPVSAARTGPETPN
jgi:hypothetical protein